jgi:ABC-type transport system involved in Fe-S cluster assembly fused permease/ATPase subunit
VGIVNIALIYSVLYHQEEKNDGDLRAKTRGTITSYLVFGTIEVLYYILLCIIFITLVSETCFVVLVFVFVHTGKPQHHRARHAHALPC